MTSNLVYLIRAKVNNSVQELIIHVKLTVVISIFELQA